VPFKSPKKVSPGYFKKGKVPKRSEDLTERQRQFSQQFVSNGGDATKAWRDTRPLGTTLPKTMNFQVYKMFHNPKVQKEIARLREEINKKYELTIEKTIRENAWIAHRDPAEMFDDDGNLLSIKNMPVHVRKTIDSFKVRRVKNEDGVYDEIIEVKMCSKSEALEKLFKHQSLYPREPKNQEAHQHIHLHLTDEQRADQLKQLAERIQSRLASPNDGRGEEGIRPNLALPAPTVDSISE
jgi:Terminase small subunit